MSEITERLRTAIADRYVIERELGAGGMATVYLAEDLKHKRKVAVKVLRPELAAVLGAERFVQEIETTANLQHPHILPLFDSGQAGGFLYYVMPYIEGETLRAKLDRETQLGIDEAVKITTEVADALDYAHRQNVIHRDIKPENILLHDGRPMVADFGIALAVSAAAGGRMTETGMSLGTPHYMSPEQATADKDLTGRADIYSLGAVLYEMLAGDPPHTGSSAQQIVMKIVTDEARPVTELRKTVPPNVAAAVARALRKVPADRFESAKAFAEALHDPTFALTDGPTGIIGTTAAPVRRSAVTFALVGIAVVAAALATWGWLRPPPPVPVVRYPTSLAAGDTRDGVGLALNVAISPDGASVVFRHEGQLYIKRREDLTAQPLAGTEGGASPFFSPDGAWIGFFADQRLRKIPSVGGGSIEIVDSVNTYATQGAWLEDGSIIYTSIPNLRRLPSEGGVSEVILSEASLGGRVPLLPKALPASRGVLFTACTVNCGQSQIQVYDARRDTARVLFEEAFGAWYAPTGHVLYLTRTGTLLAVPWDNDALVAAGPAVPVLDGIQAPGFALSAEGTVLYVLGPPLFGSGAEANAEAVWLDRSGRAEPVDASWRFNTGGGNWSVALSPDGRRLALRLLTNEGDDIWVKQLPKGPLSRLTFYEGEDRVPEWTPDGRAIMFISDRPTPTDTSRTGSYTVWQQAADGTGEPQLVWANNSPAEAVRSPDGQWLVLRTAGPVGAPGRRDIYAARPGTDSVAHPILATAYDEQGPALSPDGHWLAYVSNETGNNEVFLRPFPDVESGKWQVTSGGGAAPVWAHNGRELFYVSGGNMNAVEIRPGPPLMIGQPSVLFAIPDGVRGGSAVGGQFSLTPDDQRFLMLRNITPGDTTEAPPTLVMVQNFFRELKAKAGK